jgi:hypothetical protein
MRTIIAGSRSCTDYNILLRALGEINWTPTLVLSGCARGVDLMGERWANENNLPIEYYPAQWERYGRRAGHMRNAEMIKHGQALLAIWDGRSKGTRDIISLAKKLNYVHHVHRIKENICRQ